MKSSTIAPQRDSRVILLESHALVGLEVFLELPRRTIGIIDGLTDPSFN